MKSKYQILKGNAIDKALEDIAKKLADPKYDKQVYDLNEDYVALMHFGVTNGSQLWKELGNSDVDYKDAQGLTYKRVDQFVLRSGKIYMLDDDDEIIVDFYVEYDEKPRHIKRMITKANAEARKAAIENAAKASQQVDEFSGITGEGVIQPFNTAAQNKAGKKTTKERSARYKALQAQNAKLLGTTLDQNLSLDVVLTWTDIIGGRQSTTGRVDVQTGTTIEGVTNSWLANQQLPLQAGIDYNYKLELFDRQTNELVSLTTGIVKKGGTIKV